MAKDHEMVQKAILPQLGHARLNTRKKAIACLGNLSIYVPDKLFIALVDFLVENAEKNTKPDYIRIFIQAFGKIRFVI
jgi:hypothetical protein